MCCLHVDFKDVVFSFTGPIDLNKGNALSLIWKFSEGEIQNFVLCILNYVWQLRFLLRVVTLYLFGEGFIWPNGYLFFGELCSLWQCYCNLSYQFNLRVGIMMNKCEVMCESCERGIIRIHVFVLVFFCFDLLCYSLGSLLSFYSAHFIVGSVRYAVRIFSTKI